MRGGSRGPKKGGMHGMVLIKLQLTKGTDQYTYCFYCY